MGDVRQINGFPPLSTNPKAVLHGCEHAKTKEVDLDDSEFFAVILIPLHDSTLWHRRRLKRNNGIESGITDNHSPRVLPEMPGKG